MYTCPQCHQNAFLPECEHCNPDQNGLSDLEPADLTRKRMRDRPTPAPFRRRLASFLGRDESEVLNEYSQDIDPNQGIKGKIQSRKSL